MADSPQQPTSQTNIDELVKELSRPQGSPSVSMPSVQSVPSAGMPPRPITPPPMSANSAPVTPKLTSPVPSVPSAPKEYQSSIRTMTDDLAKLKAGQQPQGVTTPRKIEPSVPPVKPAPTAVPPVIPQKPVQNQTLAPTVKTAPIAPVTNPVPQPSPKASAGTASPAPSVIPRPTPPASVMAPATKTPELKPDQDQKNQFYVPPATTQSPAGGNKNLLFISIAVVVVLLGVLYWYFMIRPAEQVVETPVVTFTPRPTATPNAKMLDVIFFINNGGTIVLPPSGDPTPAFNKGLIAQTGNMAGTNIEIRVFDGTASESSQFTNLPGLLDRFVVSYPPELKATFGKDFKTLVYTQTENFDPKGHLIAYDSSKTSNRFVMVSEIASSSASVLQSWEPTMVKSLSGIIGVTPAKNTDSFMTTTYNGVSVRFVNFPYPNHSIDYALIQYEGKTYLVIAGSRESMFATINAFTILGK